MGRKNPEWSVSRSISVDPETARRLDALADSTAKRNRSAFLREMVLGGLVAQYGDRWTVIADALIADRDEQAA